jgi:hypothetical protein
MVDRAQDLLSSLEIARYVASVMKREANFVSHESEIFWEKTIDGTSTVLVSIQPGSVYVSDRYLKASQLYGIIGYCAYHKIKWDAPVRFVADGALPERINL